MCEWILGCDEQKYAQRGVDAYDHRQIVGVSLTPSPTGRPDDGQWVNTEYESQTRHDKRDSKIRYPRRVRHFVPLFRILETFSELG